VDLVPDLSGIELPDLAAARAEAQRALPDLARDALPDGNQRTFDHAAYIPPVSYMSRDRLTDPQQPERNRNISVQWS
jgi:hypothetical protein